MVEFPLEALISKVLRFDHAPAHLTTAWSSKSSKRVSNTKFSSPHSSMSGWNASASMGKTSEHRFPINKNSRREPNGDRGFFTRVSHNL